MSGLHDSITVTPCLSSSAVISPPSETDSATTQPWEGDNYAVFSSFSSSDEDASTSSPKHNLTAETYNMIFQSGFRDAMVRVFEEVEKEEYAVPEKRKTPSADMSPVEAFRQGFNLALAVAIVEEGGRDDMRKWKPWVIKRWKARV